MTQYKITIQKSVVFLCTKNKISKDEIKKKIPLTIAPKKIKHLAINLNREVKYMYTETCQSLLKGTEEYTNKWKYISCTWIRKINIVKICLLPKAIYRFYLLKFQWH